MSLHERSPAPRPDGLGEGTVADASPGRRRTGRSPSRRRPDHTGTRRLLRDHVILAHVSRTIGITLRVSARRTAIG